MSEFTPELPAEPAPATSPESPTATPATGEPTAEAGKGRNDSVRTGVTGQPDWESLVPKFEPVDGVNYGWIAEHTKFEFEERIRVMKGLDDKCAALMTFLSAIVSVVTLGSIGGLSAAKVPPVVVWAALPSLLCAIVGLIFGLYARRTFSIHRPPSGMDLANWANHYGDSEKAKAAFIPLWDTLTDLVLPAIQAKAFNLKWAVYLSAGSVGLLLLPFLATLVFVEPKP